MVTIFVNLNNLYIIYKKNSILKKKTTKYVIIDIEVN